jgi:hypothetical protein
MLKDKVSKVILLTAIYLLNISATYAVTPVEASSKEYLQYQGHSKEASRLVEIECAKAQGKEIPPSGESNMKIWKWTLSPKHSTFVRNLIKDDPTLPTEEVGTPEN